MPDLATTNAGRNALANGDYAPTHMEIGSQGLTGSLIGRTSIGTRIAVIDASFVVVNANIAYVGIDTDDARTYNDFRTLGVWAGHPDDAGSILLEIGSTGDTSIYGEKQADVDLLISGGTAVRGSQLAQVDISALVAIDNVRRVLAEDEALSIGSPLTLATPTGKTWADYRWLEFIVGPDANISTEYPRLRTSAFPIEPINPTLYIADSGTNRCTR